MKPFAFVLMPFSAKFDDVYQFGIKQLCIEKEIIAERVDEQQFTGTILERIYRQIENADLIIADMTDQNPNVFYEVGYSHARGKLCILATQSASDIPFDLKQHPHVIYNGTALDLKEKLASRLEWAKDEIKKRKAERVSTSVRVVDPSLKKEHFAHTGSFDLVIDFRNQTSQRSPEFEAVYVKIKKEWKVSAHGKECPFDIVDDGKIKRVLLTPSIRRLAPGAFSQERVSIERNLWTKWGGQEQKEEYPVKGTIRVELSTSEGPFSYEFSIEVLFEEFPF